MVETLVILNILLSGAAAVLAYLALGRASKVERMLEIPQVKKLTPDLKLKHHRKGNLYQGGAKMEEVGESEGRNNSKRDGRDSKHKEAKPAQARAAGSTRKEEAPVEKAEKSEKADRGDRNDRNDRNGRRDRKRPRPRFEASSEIMSNQEEAAVERTETVVEAPKAVVTETPKVEAPRAEAPVSNRPALAPRGQRSEVQVETHKAADSDDDMAPPPIDPSTIRHGRRNVVRKSPAVDDGED